MWQLLKYKDLRLIFSGTRFKKPWDSRSTAVEGGSSRFIQRGTRQDEERGEADMRDGSPLVSFNHVTDLHFVTFTSSLYTMIYNPNPNPNPNHSYNRLQWSLIRRPYRYANCHRILSRAHHIQRCRRRRCLLLLTPCGSRHHLHERVSSLLPFFKNANGHFFRKR